MGSTFYLQYILQKISNKIRSEVGAEDSVTVDVVVAEVADPVEGSVAAEDQEVEGLEGA